MKKILAALLASYAVNGQIPPGVPPGPPGTATTALPGATEPPIATIPTVPGTTAFPPNVPNLPIGPITPPNIATTTAAPPATSIAAPITTAAGTGTTTPPLQPPPPPPPPPLPPIGPITPVSPATTAAPVATAAATTTTAAPVSTAAPGTGTTAAAATTAAATTAAPGTGTTDAQTAPVTTVAAPPAPPVVVASTTAAPTTPAPTTPAPTFNQYCPPAAALQNIGQLPMGGLQTSQNAACQTTTGPNSIARDWQGMLTCNTYHCCLCSEINCGGSGFPCDTLKIADSGAVGVKNIVAIGSNTGVWGTGGWNNGADIECSGLESCKRGVIKGQYVHQMSCTGDFACEGTSITLEPNDEMNVQCNGMMSCMNANIDIIIGPTTMVSQLGTIECNGQQSCQGLTVTIRNFGGTPVILRDLECMNPTACPNFNIVLEGNIMIENCDLQGVQNLNALPLAVQQCQLHQMGAPGFNNWNPGFPSVPAFPASPVFPAVPAPVPAFPAPAPAIPAPAPRPIPPIPALPQQPVNPAPGIPAIPPQPVNPAPAPRPIPPIPALPPPGIPALPQQPVNPAPAPLPAIPPRPAVPAPAPRPAAPAPAPGAAPAAVPATYLPFNANIQLDCTPAICQNKIITIQPTNNWKLNCPMPGSCSGLQLTLNVGLDPYNPGMPVDRIDGFTFGGASSGVNAKITINNVGGGMFGGFTQQYNQIEVNDIRCEHWGSCSGLTVTMGPGIDVMGTNVDCQMGGSCNQCSVNGQDCMTLSMMNNQGPAYDPFAGYNPQQFNQNPYNPHYGQYPQVPGGPVYPPAPVPAPQPQTQPGYPQQPSGNIPPIPMAPGLGGPMGGPVPPLPAGMYPPQYNPYGNYQNWV